MVDGGWQVGMACSFASALLLLLSFPGFDLHYFAFVSLVPLFVVVFTSTFKRAFACGVATSFLFFTLHLFWVNAYFPAFGVAFVTIVYGCQMTAAILVINLVSRAFPRWRAAAAPFIWVSFEYVRSLGFLGLTFGSLGYSQHGNLRLIQVADIGGEPLVSFIVLLFNAGLAHLALGALEWSSPAVKRTGRPPLRRPGRSVFPARALLGAGAPFAAAIAIVSAALAYGSVRLAEALPLEPSAKIALIQGLSSPRSAWKQEKWATLSRLIDLSERSVRYEPGVDLVVWTETAIRTALGPNLASGTPYHLRIRDLVKRLGTRFIIGSPDSHPPGDGGEADSRRLGEVVPGGAGDEWWTNSAYFLDADGEIIGKYDKIKLTPFGEHFPLGERVPILGKILGRFTDSAGFTAGTEYTVFENGELDFSVVICWEGMFGAMIRRFVGNGADFIINISNDMWSGTKAGHFQHFTATKFRAVENRIWLVRAANDGVTAFVNPRGEVVGALRTGVTGFLTCTVGPKVQTTYYTRHGEILPKAGLCVTGALFLASLTVMAGGKWKER